MPPSGEVHLDLALAALTSLGGIMGYVKAKSLPSLIGGLGFGAAFAATGYLIQNHDALVGHSVGCATSLVMMTLMGVRFSKTRKIMPAGILCAAGIVGTSFHAYKAKQWA